MLAFYDIAHSLPLGDVGRGFSFTEEVTLGLHLFPHAFINYFLLFQRRFTPVKFATCIGLTWTSHNRPYSVNQITKNMELISSDNDIQIDKSMPLHLTSPKFGENNKPLVVMLSWLMAKKKHILKYANFYMDQGFDVLSVSITPWQLLWPVKGTQVRVT